MINHIIFDIDGTLVDSSSLLLSTLKEIAQRYVPHPVTKEDLYSMWYGKTGDECIEALGVKPYLRAEALQLWCDLIVQEANNTSVAFEGILDMFEQLKVNNITCSYATSRDDRIANYGLEHAGILKYCSALVSAGMTNHTKPHPDPILLCTKLCGAQLEHTLFIGDAFSDYQAAQAAGIPFAFAGWNSQATPFTCMFHLNHPSEVLRLIATL